MSNKPISVPSYGAQKVTVDNLTKDEIELLRASMIAGHHWVRRGVDGRLEFVPSYEELPGPITDTEMLPFWRRPIEGECMQEDMFGFDPATEAELQHAGSPSIYITSLCGYHYSAENYKFQAEQLTEWGFVCMRSQRGATSGQFWEVWFLPGLWAAKGRLKEVISESKAKSTEEQLKRMYRFLNRRASFGSLHVTIQRMAMVIHD